MLLTRVFECHACNRLIKPCVYTLTESFPPEDIDCEVHGASELANELVCPLELANKLVFEFVSYETQFEDFELEKPVEAV